MTIDTAINWAATALNFVPLIWMTCSGHGRDVAFWWVAIAYGIGGFGDLGAWSFLGWEMAGKVYPVGQCALMAAVLLDRDSALMFLVALGFTAFLSVMFWPTHPDWVLHVVGWFGVALIAWRSKAIGPLWLSLFWAFGLQLPAYLWFMQTRANPQWFLMQGCYAVGLGWFCLAASRTRNGLRAVG